jgi:endonuclease/exonuclease/phosphatase (EEP) superfamily protein YafD
MITAAVLLYALAVFTWAGARYVLGDGYWLLGLINGFAVYLFAPLPLAAIISLRARRTARVAVVALAILFLSLFGRDLLPPLRRTRAAPDSPVLTAMTYNVLVSRPDVDLIARTVNQAEPDVVAFQELSAQVIGQLEQQIGERLPYHTGLHPGCRAGSDIWSRYPLRPESIQSHTQCRLRSAIMDLDGRDVRVISLHAQSYTGIRPARIKRDFVWRRVLVEELLAEIEGLPEPLLFLADLNSTPMHEVYQIVSARLTDAFREAGQGLGHTFPARRQRTRYIPYLTRLARIDYVFHSADWTAEEAWVAEWDGHSDHLPVVARLRLRQ